MRRFRTILIAVVLAGPLVGIYLAAGGNGPATALAIYTSEGRSYVSVYWNEERRVRTGKSSSSSGHVEAIATFDAATGEPLASRRLATTFFPISLYADSCPLWHRDRRVLILSCGKWKFPVLDPITLEQVADLGDAISAKLGGRWRVHSEAHEGWQTNDIDAESLADVKVETPDGKMHHLKVEELLKGKLPPPKHVERLTGWDLCEAAVADTEQGKPHEGLLRSAVVVRYSRNANRRTPCSYDLAAGTSRIVLHRSTTFGDGAYLLSALPRKEKPAWTLDVSQLFGPQPKDVRIVEPRVEGDGILSLWVLRGRHSLEKVRIDGRTGKLVDTKMVWK